MKKDEPKTLTIRGTIRTDRSGSDSAFEFPVDADDWNSMTPEQQEEMAKEAAFGCIEWNYDVIEDD